MLLDDYLPEPDVRDRHTRFVRAPRESVLVAWNALCLSEMSSLVAVLFAIRGLPHMIIERRLPRRVPSTRPLLEDMLAADDILEPVAWCGGHVCPVRIGRRTVCTALDALTPVRKSRYRITLSQVNGPKR